VHQTIILRIEIDGNWSAKEMATFIGVLSEIYSLLYAVLAKIPESELRTLVYPEQEIKQSFRQALEEPSHLFAAKLAPDVAFGDFSVPRFDIESAVTQIAAKYFSTSLLFGRSRVREFSNELAGVLHKELQRYLANALTEISHDVERRMFEVLEAYRRSVDKAITSLKNQYPIQTSADSLLPLLPKDRYSIMEVRAIQYASPGP
jgi:hypothetical protein